MLCPLNVAQVMLGSGDPDYEKWMAWAESAYTDKYRGWVGFSVPVAHRITAGYEKVIAGVCLCRHRYLGNTSVS